MKTKYETYQMPPREVGDHATITEYYPGSKLGPRVTEVREFEIYGPYVPSDE
jgi:hypothetical protein